MNGAMRTVLLAAAASVGMMQGVAATVANKTYFSPRNELQQGGRVWALAAPFTKTTPGDRGVELTSTAFCSKTTNSLGLGRYFGASLKADFSDANGTVNITQSSLGLPHGLFDRQIDHTYSVGGGEAAMYGAIKLAPVQKRTGMIGSAAFDFGKLCGFEGWHATVTAPFVSVTNNLGVTYPTSVAAVAGTTKAATAQSTVAQYFAGNYTQGGGNSQQSLFYGKVLDTDMTSSGLADVKATMGYDLVREIDGGVELRAGLIIPLGAHPTAERLFEAVHGNGSHFGLIAGGRGDMLLWENKEKRLALWGVTEGEFTFLLSGREKRIAGVYNSDPNVSLTVPWGHAGLGVQYQQPGVFPLANVLARDMDVMPGAHFDSTLGLSLVYRDFYFNFGYNMFFRRTETVDMADQWPVDRYGMATYAALASNPALNFRGTSLSDATADSGTTRSAVGPLNLINGSASHLTFASGTATVLYQVDTSVCTAPDQETHQALLGAGYRGAFKGVPLEAAAFAGYEFPFDSSKAVRGWALGAKISARF